MHTLFNMRIPNVHTQLSHFILDAHFVQNARFKRTQGMFGTRILDTFETLILNKVCI